MEKKKITIVGAGGYAFPIKLIADMLSWESLQDAHYCLYDIVEEGARRTARLMQVLVDGFQLGATHEVTTDPKRAFDGADYIFVTFQVGGLDAYKIDKDIPAKYGIDLPVGDTLNAGGIFRGLRSLGALEPYCEMIREGSPDALAINYANPMAILTWAMNGWGVPTVGLCHSVQAIPHIVERQIGIPAAEVTFKTAGINHQAWVVSLHHRGRDVLADFNASFDVDLEAALHGEDRGAANIAINHGGNYEDDAVRAEIVKTFGYYHTESSHHGSEYVPWFRKNKERIDHYIPRRWDYYEICTRHSEENLENRVKEMAEMDAIPRTSEYGSYILHSIETDTPFVIYGNVPNSGRLGIDSGDGAISIPNLPRDCCVEVACLCDGEGVRPTVSGALPEQCAAINRTNINVQAMAVRGHRARSRKMIEMAVALDPLTGALCTLPEIRGMTADFFEAQEKWLPQFD